MIIEIAKYLPAIAIVLGSLFVAGRQLHSVRRVTHENGLVMKVMSGDWRNL